MDPVGVSLLVTAALLWLVALLLLLMRKPSGARHRKNPVELDLLGHRMQITQVFHDPVIRVVHGFVTSTEAGELIEEYRSLLAPSTVASNDHHTSNSLHASRTSWSAFLPAGSSGDLIEKIEDRAVLISGKPMQFMETLQLVRYEGSEQFYRNHFDYFHNDPESQRTTTIFVYLNDTSGEAPTSFPRLGLEVLPKCGSACVWENCYAHGRGLKCDDRLEHAGVPPKTVTKYGLNIWFRTLPFRN